MSKAKEIYEKLRTEIISGKLAPGAILIETEIAERYGVSRTPAREAIKLLEAYEHASRLHSGVVVVADYPVSELFDNLEIREALESKAIRLACERATGEQIRYAGECLAEATALADGRDIDRFVAANLAFHKALLEGCGNRLLLSLIFSRWHRYHDRRIIGAFTGRDWRRVVREHQAMFEGLRDRDPQAASKAVSKHLNTSIAVAKERMLKPVEA